MSIPLLHSKAESSILLVEEDYVQYLYLQEIFLELGINILRANTIYQGLEILNHSVHLDYIVFRPDLGSSTFFYFMESIHKLDLQVPVILLDDDSMPLSLLVSDSSVVSVVRMSDSEQLKEVFTDCFKGLAVI